MNLVVNGQPHKLSAETLAAALKALNLDDAVVATALNGRFVRAGERARTPLAEGDRIEIVAPMQGG